MVRHRRIAVVHVVREDSIVLRDPLDQLRCVRVFPVNLVRYYKKLVSKIAQFRSQLADGPGDVAGERPSQVDHHDRLAVDLQIGRMIEILLSQMLEVRYQGGPVRRVAEIDR